MEKTSNALKSKANDFINTLKSRYSCYALAKGSVLSDQDLIKFVEKCIYYNPSAFNVQSTRVVMLFGNRPKLVWTHVLGLMPKDYPELLVKELENCRESHVIFLFFDDCNATKKAAEDYHMNIENFESWAVQSLAMLQITLWNGLTHLGYGANIQHYNRQLDEFTKKEYDLPSHWKLLAQMNVGLPSNKKPTRMRIAMDHLLAIRK